MKTDGRPFQVKTGRPVRGDAQPRQPNEHDESADSQESAPRSDMVQAYRDVMSGQQDTDCREQRGVESVSQESEQNVCPSRPANGTGGKAGAGRVDNADAATPARRK